MSLILGVDPGHGGEDDGAVANGITEADWNMVFARFLTQRVNKGGQPWKAVLLRSHESETVSLMERGEKSKTSMCDLVFSIHVNAMRSHPEWHGLTTYHWPGSWVARELGNTLMRCAPKPLFKPGWGSTSCDDDLGDWIQNPRNVLRVHQCPAVLIEVGYCTNKNDAAVLCEGAIRAGLASMIELTLSHYRFMKERTP